MLISESLPQESIAWPDLHYLSKIIPRVCHNVNRVCYIFGGAVERHISDITPTCLTPNVIETLREADSVANAVMESAQAMGKVTQMPLVRGFQFMFLFFCCHRPITPR